MEFLKRNGVGLAARSSAAVFWVSFGHSRTDSCRNCGGKTLI